METLKMRIDKSKMETNKLGFHYNYIFDNIWGDIEPHLKRDDVREAIWNIARSVISRNVYSKFFDIKIVVYNTMKKMIRDEIRQARRQY